MGPTEIIAVQNMWGGGRWGIPCPRPRIWHVTSSQHQCWQFVAL